VCGHAVLADSLRFYASRGGVACFCYDHVRPNQIHFPAPKLRYLDAMQASLSNLPPARHSEGDTVGETP
jgi:hypothetical protein